MPQSKNRVDSKSTKNAPAASSSATNKPRQIEKQTLPKDGNKTAENLDSDVPEIDPFVLETEDSDDIDEDLDEEIKSFAKETEGKKFLLTRGTLDNEVDDESFSDEDEDLERDQRSKAKRSNPSNKFRIVDPETQARLEALLEAAGIRSFSEDTKQLTDPEVLKKLSSSFSITSALDEAASVLTRMKSSPSGLIGSQQSLEQAGTSSQHQGPGINNNNKKGNQESSQPPSDLSDPKEIAKLRKLLAEGRLSADDTTEEGESFLLLACHEGYYELAQVLLAMHANTEERGSKNDNTPLMEAARAGHLDIVKLLMSHGADVNAQSQSGNTPLMHACIGGHEDIVSSLLEAGARVEDHNENGHTPLMEAASAGHVGVAKILLEFGAGINTHSNEFKESALTLACYKGHLEMVRFLLEAGADQEHKTDEMHTALMEASMDGHVEVARLLLDSGAHVNMPADSFESPLTLAACGGHVELAMLLLERGANIEEVNDEGYTPLMEAAREGHEEMVALLLSQGADINAQTDETQETALTLACCGGFLEVSDFLIKAGADIELGASTPLMEAAQEGHLELVRYLLDSGTKVNAISTTQDTGLTYACENGHTEVVELLLKYGADLEHYSEGGRTPIMKAARAGHLSTVQFLIARGANVNRTTVNNDHTPLSLACAGGHKSVVETLLQQGADPFYKLKDNSTMLIEAAKGGHTTVVQLLLDYPNSFGLSASFDLVDSSGQIPLQPPLATTPTDLGAQNTGIVPDPSQVGGVGGKMAKSTLIPETAGYDYFENSGFLLHGEGDVKLDAKSYIQSILNRTEGASREEQLQQKEQILAELQIVEKELQEKAQAHVNLNQLQRENADGAPSTPPSYVPLHELSTPGGGTGASSSGTTSAESVLRTAMSEAGLVDAINNLDLTTSASTGAGDIDSAQQNLANLNLEQQQLQHQQSCQKSPGGSGMNMLSQRALASLPPSERPKAKPSRKSEKAQLKRQQQGSVATSLLPRPPLSTVVSSTTSSPSTTMPSVNSGVAAAAAEALVSSSSACSQELQAALQQHSQQVAQLHQLQQLNEQLQQQVMQQRQLKQQNQANLALLQKNAIVNQQQLADLQRNVAQLQQLEHHILTQQQQQDNQQQSGLIKQGSTSGVSTPPSSSATSAPFTTTASGQTNQQLLQQGVQQIIQQKQQLQQQFQQFKIQVEQQLAYTQHTTQVAALHQQQQKVTSKRTKDGNSTVKSNKNAAAAASAAMAYELVQTKQALQAVKALHQLESPSSDDSSVDIEPLAQDQELLNSMDHGSLAAAVQSYATIPLDLTTQQHQALISGYKDGIQLFSGHGGATAGISAGNSEALAAFGHQLLLPGPFSTSFASDGCANASTSGEYSSTFNMSPGAGVEAYPNTFDQQLTGQDGSPMCAEGQQQPVGGQQPQRQHQKGQQPGVTTQQQNIANPIGGGKVGKKSASTKSVSVKLKNKPSQKTAELLFSDPNQPVSNQQQAQQVYSEAEVHQLGLPPTGLPVVDLDSATESNHDTALTLACTGGHEELVKLLLDRGADLEHRDKKGFTPLILAATSGHDKVVEILLTKKAEIEAQSERTKDTPLSLACSGGRYEVVEVLLNHGANKEHRNVSDYTPLSLAASGGYVNIIKLLLSHGAEINSRTGSKLGISPLMLAAMNGHTAAVKLLLDQGSDINAQIETNRNTALTLACFQGRHEVVSLLLDRRIHPCSRANVEHRAKTGLTPLMEAASGGYVDVGRVLLDKGADVNAPPVPSSRDTALTIAADKGHYRFVELLLSRGASVDVRNKKGNSSLWLAASGGHLDVVQLLHSAGADIDSQDNRKVSCLMAAFRKGHTKVVKWMVKHVNQFPSDQELTRFIATIPVGEKDLLKKCQQCMDVIRVAKDRQAAEAAKNANILLEELDRESKMEQSKKEAAARKREKKRRRKLERQGKNPDEEPAEQADEDDKENNSDEDDGKESSPEKDNLQVEVISKTPQPKESTPEVEKSPPQQTEKKKKESKGKGKNKLKREEPEDVPPPPAIPEPIVTTIPIADPKKKSVSNENVVQNKKSNKNNNKDGNKSQASNKTAGSVSGSVLLGQLSSQSGTVAPPQQTGWKEVVRKSKKVTVPTSSISRVIGRQGCNIKAIRELSGAHIEVEKQSSKSSSDRTISIKGSADATRQANQWISSIISNPEKDLADIIGKQYVKYMQQQATIVGGGNMTSAAETAAMLGSSFVTASTQQQHSGGLQSMVFTNKSNVATSVTMTSASTTKPSMNTSGNVGSNKSSSSKVLPSTKTQQQETAKSNRQPSKIESFAAIVGGGGSALMENQISENDLKQSSTDSAVKDDGLGLSSITTDVSNDNHQPNTMTKQDPSYSPFKFDMGWSAATVTTTEMSGASSNFMQTSPLQTDNNLTIAIAAKAPGFRNPNHSLTSPKVDGFGGSISNSLHSSPTKQKNEEGHNPSDETIPVVTNSLNSINDRANSAPGTPVHPSASVIQPPPPIGNNNVVPPVGAVSIAPIGPPKPGQQRSSNDFASTMTPIGRPPSGSGGYGIIGSGLGGSNSSIIRSKTPERDPILEGGIPPSSNQVSSALSGGIIGSNRPSSATLGPALPLGVYDAGGNTKRNIETLAPSSGLLGSSTNFGNIGGATSGEFNIPPPIAGGATNLMSNNFDLGGFGSGGGSAFASVRSKYQTPFSGTLGRKMPGEVNRLGDPTDYLSQIPPSTTVNSAYNYKSGNGNNLSSSGLFGHPPPVRGTSGGSYNFPNSTGGANGNNSGGFGGGNTSILNQTSINSLLQQQFPPSLPPPPAPPAELNFDTISMIGGKSLQELTDLLAATTPDSNSSPFNMPPPSVNPQARSGGMSGPSYGNPSSFSGSGLGNVNNFGGHGGGLMDNMDPKISRPIGSERSRQNLAPGKQGMAPINNWGKMDLQSTGNNDLTNGSSNLQQVGGYGSNLVGQTLEGILKHQNEYGNISGGVGGASGTLPFATDSYYFQNQPMNKTGKNPPMKDDKPMNPLWPKKWDVE